VIRNILADPNTIPWHEEARQRGLNSIIALPLIVDGKTIGILDILARDLEAFDADEVNLLEELAAAVSHGIWSLRGDADRQRAEAEVQHTLEQLDKSLDSTVVALSNSLETRDPYTAGHQRRVAQLACAIAREIRLSPEQIRGIRVLGFLHDIGKIAVPAEILSRPGKISPNEFNIIQMHPETGYDIIKDIEFPWPVARAILEHHERLDGSGYPKGLTDPDISKEAKILAVADVVEAMASHRPYRPGLGIDQALEEISRMKGVLYDPQVVDACIELFTEKGFKFK
jgi:putative nucleotidyltransferase with HDIG domain